LRLLLINKQHPTIEYSQHLYISCRKFSFGRLT